MGGNGQGLCHPLPGPQEALPACQRSARWFTAVLVLIRNENGESYRVQGIIIGERLACVMISSNLCKLGVGLVTPSEVQT